jgi:DNA-binding MarR family transcriptional regulator
VAFDEITVQVMDVTPKADFTADWLVPTGKGTTFDASTSKDSITDVPSLVYNWSFGDGTEGNGKAIEHVFARTGDFTVSLTVTDQHGLKGTIRKVISVVAADLLARVGDKILTIDYSVSDLVDGTPGILPGEIIRVTGAVGMVQGWDGPDLLSSHSAAVTVHVVGLTETWETTTALDGTFSLTAIAPFKTGKFEVRVVANMTPFSAEATSQHEVQKEETVAGPVSMPLVAGVATATAGLIAIGAVGSTDLGRYKFFTLLIPLFTRLRRPKILDHFERGRIYEHIRKTPGDSYSSIRKALGLKNGALAHHLRVLEAHEYIVSRRDGMYRRFYPKGMRIPEGGHKSIQEQLLEMIMSNPRITQKEMAERVGIDRSTVNYHIKILMAMGVIRSEKDGKVKFYYFVGIKAPLPYEG